MLQVIVDLSLENLGWSELLAFNRELDNALSYFELKAILTFAHCYKEAVLVYDNRDCFPPFVTQEFIQMHEEKINQELELSVKRAKLRR